MKRGNLSPMVEPPLEHDEGRTFRSQRFWMHLVNNFFRRSVWYALPIVVMFIIGGLVARGSSAEFSSVATLDASNNPLVEELDIRGDDPLFRKTAADSTANFISEQLRTDVFATEVADKAGLGALLDAEVITNNTIREHVSIRANGDSIIVVAATWGDPVTAQLLAEATIDSYREYVVETVANDSLAAEQFFTELLNRATSQAGLAEDELDEYVKALPPLAPDEERTIEQDLKVERLSRTLERAETNVETATSAIEAARLEVAKSRSEAGQSIRLIDAPEVPVEQEPRLFQIAGVMLIFLSLGFLISATALILTTALDHTVRFELDAVHQTGNQFVTSVPVLKSLRLRSKRRNDDPVIEATGSDAADVDAADDGIDHDASDDNDDRDDDHLDDDVDDVDDADDVDDVTSPAGSRR